MGGTLNRPPLSGFSANPAAKNRRDLRQGVFKLFPFSGSMAFIKIILQRSPDATPLPWS